MGKNPFLPKNKKAFIPSNSGMFKTKPFPKRLESLATGHPIYTGEEIRTLGLRPFTFGMLKKVKSGKW